METVLGVCSPSLYVPVTRGDSNRYLPDIILIYNFSFLIRYRPDLLNWDSLEPHDIVQNNQLAFDILESELGLQPVTTGQEVNNFVVVHSDAFGDANPNLLSEDTRNTINCK
jgi:hypothetical protein